MIDLEELRRKAKAATPGPFFIERRDDDSGGIEYIVYGGKDYAWCLDALDKRAKFNAAFIAAANPATILRLLEAYQVLRDALEYYRDDSAYKEPRDIGIPTNFKSDQAASVALAKAEAILKGEK